MRTIGVGTPQTVVALVIALWTRVGASAIQPITGIIVLGASGDL